MSTTGGIKVFSGNANPKLAEEIARHLGCDMGHAFTERFSDGEFNFQPARSDFGAAGGKPDHSGWRRSVVDD